MSKENTEINPYYVLGKLLEKNIDYNKVKDFVEQFVVINVNNGEQADDVLQRLKNFSMELNDAILTSSVAFQSSLNAPTSDDPTSDRLTVNAAAEIYGVSSATIRNWINDEKDPLPHLNVGERQTTILFSDLMEYAKKKGRNIVKSL